MANVLEVERLCKRYVDKNFMLKNVSFSIPYGTIIGFIGENGAGKSTTMGLILGTLHKDEGFIRIFGEELESNKFYLKEDIGVVFDEMYLPGQLNIEKLGKVFRHIYQNWDQKTFNQYIDLFSLPKNKKISNFSRGMSMKLSTAVSLSHDAKLLILDEATAGLDPSSRENLLQVLKEYVKDGQRSILLSSHITSDIEKIADALIFIRDGEILLQVNKETLLSQYAILQCKYREFEQIESDVIVAYEKNDDTVDVLISDLERVSPSITRKNFSIDDVTLLLMRGKKT
ncbi:ABC transporter ATP-binding protein [Cytobacillus sp. IB215316]|uniref:ABC transporter ATP-binding protein n=1 Tax=Cytobacillus sp. IB215316 TaxID=3097354 RepID=UPI002A168C38|nr:ABC transporter ATP-binding protein [Cytobacillus sp. IB215316]MDX8360388.1 ABC transporter ATP-binding protein [Cytobacillus sp. IB215316]